MFDGRATSVIGLHTFCHSCCNRSCHIRIFGIIFKVSSAKRISVNVHTWSQPECHAKMFHLRSNHRTDFTDQFLIPCLCQKSSYRNCCAVLIISFSRKFSGIIVEKSTLQAEFERHGNNAAFVYMIVFHQTKSRRSISKNNACQPFVDSTSVCLSC